MEKLLVLPASRSKMEALKAFLAALKIEFRSIASGDEATAEISDPELIERIEDYEQGKTMPQAYSLEELKALLHA